ALEHSRQRLGDLAAQVRWVVGDVTTRLFEDQSVDLWHDRAVFHFLTTPEQRAAYREHLVNALRPGGFVILATFGPNGPERCSGLPVARYSAAGLAEVLGPDFELLVDDSETHTTPGGSGQAFTYALFRHGPRDTESTAT
ncbi:MAG TPA: methyltransferase domain-containing protein, partial [Myxococcota bacterium]|nr:methyltransferase domain-containing protein [Myxococcota bacterium]